MEKTNSNFFNKIKSWFRKEIPVLASTEKYGDKTREDWWITKFPEKPIIYNAQDSMPRDVRNFIFPKSYILDKAVSKYKLKGPDDSSTVLKCCVFVQDYIRYVGDMESRKQDEFWQCPEDTLTRRTGDCVAEYEEVYTIDGIKKASAIKLGDLVLSYDFKNKEFVYRPIINLWDKGIKEVKRVHFRNGQHTDVTDEHHMCMRINQKGNSIYKKTDLRDVDLTRWWRRKVPIAKSIPYGIRDIEWLTEDLCIVLGHYIAEGWKEQHHVRSSGYELVDNIIPILEEHNIPFSEYVNNSGVPCINFLNSNFKDYLKMLKNNSFDIHIIEEIFHLPKNKLENILYGMWLGDGTKLQYPDNRGYTNNKEWTYSTSSEQLARDIQRIGLQLGRSFHIWRQEDHQGVGDQPIYRINYNSNSHFLKDHGYKDLSEVSISYIEDLGEFQTYDWEVQDTHTFVFKNGIISYQCEDGAILMKSLTLCAGVPDWKVKIVAGNVKGGGHAYCAFIRDDDTQVIIDWCYWPNRLHPNARPKMEDEQNYYEIWFSFNHNHSYAETKVEYSKGNVKK